MNDTTILLKGICKRLIYQTSSGYSIVRQAASS